MSANRRRRRPALPHFAALEHLAPGQAFNPFRLFEGWSARGAVLAFRKLRPGPKALWLLLADQVYASGHDEHSQSELARRLAVTPRQLRRYFRQLLKLRLVHIEHSLGVSNFHWLLFHDLFANCSPRPQDKDVRRGRTEVSEGSGHKGPTQSTYQRNYQRNGGATEFQTTTGSVPSDQNGRRQSENSPPEESPDPDFRYRRDCELTLKPDFKPHWYVFTPNEKRMRLERASGVHEKILHFQTFLKDPAEPIRRQARHEVNRLMAELSSLGFYIQTETRTK